MDLILTDRPLPAQLEGAHQDRTVIHVAEQKIAPCVGCFGCWIKTPGRCVIRDDAPAIYPLIAHCSRLLVVSRLLLGCYDIPMKRVVERSLPNQQPFIRLHHGETHHVQRSVRPKQLTVIAYGAEDQEEKQIFERWLRRNGLNTLAEDCRIRYAEHGEQAAQMAWEEVRTWEN